MVLATIFHILEYHPLSLLLVIVGILGIKWFMHKNKKSVIEGETPTDERHL